MKQMELEIQGMTCTHCARAVRDALEGCEGVESAQVDLHRRRASVSGQAEVEKLREAVREVGYDVGEVRRQG